MNEPEEPPASTFTPIPLETLDWDQAQAAIRAVELKLAGIKRDFAAMFPADGRTAGTPMGQIGGS